MTGKCSVIGFEMEYHRCDIIEVKDFLEKRDAAFVDHLFDQLLTLFFVHEANKQTGGGMILI